MHSSNVVFEASSLISIGKCQWTNNMDETGSDAQPQGHVRILEGDPLIREPADRGKSISPDDECRGTPPPASSRSQIVDKLFRLHGAGARILELGNIRKHKGSACDE